MGVHSNYIPTSYSYLSLGYKHKASPQKRLTKVRGCCNDVRTLRLLNQTLSFDRCRACNNDDDDDSKLLLAYNLPISVLSPLNLNYLTFTIILCLLSK